MATKLLPQLAAFLAVVEAGSFTRAGRRAGVDKTVLSRRVKALEKALQVQLLHRTTRSLRVTEAGRALSEAAGQPMAEAIAALQVAASPDQVHGAVRVATFPESAPRIWAPVLRQLRERYPDLELFVSASESMVPLVEQGFDLAVRTGRMPDSSLVSRRLAQWRYVLVASPEWVAAHPEVQAPGDLAAHWLLYGDVPNANRWRFERGDQAVDVQMDAVVTFDNSSMLRAAALAGLGATAAPPPGVEHHLEEGRLVRVLPDWRVAHVHGIYGVTPGRQHLPARVEVVLEAVRRRLEELEPRWEEWAE